MTSDLDKIRRWETAGGVWRIVARTSDSVTIALCQCTGGEEVERFVSRDADVITLVDPS